MVTNKEKKRLKRRSFVLFKDILKNNEKFKDLKTKLNNVNGKTGSYNVPDKLFQVRTNRSNRVLIDWKTVMKNELTLDDLSLFEGDVVVAFINNDYFDQVEPQHKELFTELKKLLGSDDPVSSMILIKSVGESSSKIERDAYGKLVREFPDYKNHLIKRKDVEGRFPGKGNHLFEGFIYYDISGGQQEGENSHEGLDSPQLFNPAVEYASTNVRLDTDLALFFFALKSVSIEKREKDYHDLISDFKSTLKEIKYTEISNEETYDSLLDYCNNHPSLRIDYLNKSDKQLYDPIQFEKIHLEDFAMKDKSNVKNLDLSHNIPVNFEKIHVDRTKNEILSAARPTNLFWSRHLSNMMQQSSTLIEFFEQQEKLVNLRNEILNIEKNNN